MDSRTYLFIYPLTTNADIPADFPKEIGERPFEAGVFLPQDGSNWHTRSPRFPARLLLLEGQSLWIVPHPSSGQPIVEIRMLDLTQLETGYILLLGWVKLATSDGFQEIVYNTRASRPLEKFLVSLRNRWLPRESPAANATSAVFGDDLDIKFRNLLHFELGREETILLQWFQTAAKIERKFLFPRRVNWLAGQLVLLTSANRILWITDHYKRYRELYAGISRSAPLRLFESCDLENTEDRMYLVVSFQAGNTWRMPVRSAADAFAFSRALREQVSAYLDRRRAFGG